MRWIEICNYVICFLFSLCYAYQIFYMIYSFFHKPVHFPPVPETHRLAILVAARNEEAVIGTLCESIKKQTYPADLLDVYVVADNCTDRTREVAEEHGATVYERTNKTEIGKGYALTFLFDKIREEKGTEYYDAFLIVDADNRLDPRFVTEMNRCMSADHKIITSYRNSTNYGKNWISAGYALWFLRASRQLNNPRFLLGVSCEVNGTGFLVHKDIINRQGGWIHHLLIEDIEFTMENVLAGEKIAYCHDAIIYDEQPVGFRQSWRQRRRWARGFIQVLHKFGLRLWKGLLTGKGFSNYDLLMEMAPAFFLTSAALVLNGVAILLSLLIFHEALKAVLISAGTAILLGYLLTFSVGAFTGIFEWKRIHATTAQKILSFFTFPIFMFTYIPICVSAFFAKAEWKPITHTGK